LAGESVDILVKGAAVVPVEPPGLVIEEGYVAISDGKIVGIGRLESMPSYAAEEVIEAKGMAALPGLINAHTHVPMTILRGVARDKPLKEWLHEIWKYEARMGREEVLAGARLGVMEMMLSGTTTIADMYFYEEEVARAVLEAGIRAVLSYGLIDMRNWVRDEEKTERELRETERFIKEWHMAEDGRIRAAVAPHAAYTCSKEILIRSAELAKSRGLVLHIHLSETRREVEEVRSKTGLSPPDYLESLGVLGPNVLAAHGVWLQEREIDLVAERGASVVHCPASNLKLASGIAPVPELLRRGVNVALGTDGAASNDTLDMFREMRLAAILHRGATLNPTALKAWDALRMATINGAKALGLEGEVGSLEVGKRADLILVNMRKPHLATSHDVVSSLVFSASGADVDTVIVEGRVIVRRGEPTTMDREEVVARASEAAQRLGD